MQLVFQTRNSSMTQAKWHIGKRGGLQPVGGSEGVCNAMTAVWISRSLRKGAPLSNRSELGSQHNIAIVMGAGDVLGSGNRHDLESQGLTIVEQKRGKPLVPFLLANELKKYNGYSYFGIDGEGGGHAMGAAAVGQDYYFFDPNDGLFKLNGVEFVSFLSNHITSNYSDLLDSYEIFTVS